jgi:Sialic acid synthase
LNKPYLIAEAGVNYYDTAAKEEIPVIEAAKKYISEAKKAGADAIKFQAYKAETLAVKNSPAYWDISKEKTRSQYELFKKFDFFGNKEYEELYRYAKETGIDFLATPFDYKSADYLESMVGQYKISSSDITNFPFLKYIAGKGKPVILSTGASYLHEIEEAVYVLQNGGCKKVALLHCVLSYPCKYEDANLNRIKTLKRIFPGLEIGYSDHTLPDESMTVLSAAYLLGADIIEKHFTLDKTLEGNDHYHSGNPEDFRKAVTNFNLIREVLGNTDEKVLQCEEIPRKEARRSLVINKKLEKGTVITENDITLKRPGTGIPPKFYDIVVGRSVKHDLEEDTILQWEMI